MNLPPIATKTFVKHGILLPWLNADQEEEEAFIELALLEELVEQDHSLGMGGALLVDYDAGKALLQAELARQETRGGFYTSSEQKVKVQAIVEEIYKVLS